MTIIPTLNPAAAYQIGNINPPREAKAPAFSFGMRSGPSMAATTTPSPNKYQLPSLLGSKVATKKSLPAYTLTGRSKTGSFHEDLKKVISIIIVMYHINIGPFKSFSI